MKNKLKIFFFTAGAMIMLAYCRKEMDTPPPPPPPPPLPPITSAASMVIRVVEAGSGIAIPGATLTTFKCLESAKIGCTRSEQTGTYTTSANGLIEFASGKIPQDLWAVRLEKEGYFRKSEYDAQMLSVFDIDDTTIRVGTKDSVIISLFPFAWLKLHLKNINPYNAADWLYLRIDILQGNGMILTPRDAFFVMRPNNLDTTILHKTYGNVRNIARVSIASAAANGLETEVFSAIRQVAKGDTLFWDIGY